MSINTAERAIFTETITMLFAAILGNNVQSKVHVPDRRQFIIDGIYCV